MVLTSISIMDVVFPVCPIDGEGESLIYEHFYPSDIQLTEDTSEQLKDPTVVILGFELLTFQSVAQSLNHWPTTSLEMHWKDL